MRHIAILLLALALPALAAPPAFAPVTPLPAGQTLRLPHDFGAHPAYKTEWWYATGWVCLLYTSPSPRDRTRYRMPSSA